MMKATNMITPALIKRGEMSRGCSHSAPEGSFTLLSLIFLP